MKNNTELNRYRTSFILPCLAKENVEVFTQNSDDLKQSFLEWNSFNWSKIEIPVMMMAIVSDKYVFLYFYASNTLLQKPQFQLRLEKYLYSDSSVVILLTPVFI